MDPQQIRRMKDQMDREQAAEQLLAGALNSAMSNPHTVEQIYTFGVAYTSNNDGGILSIATPAGRRIDLHLDPGVAETISAAINGGNGA